MITNKYKNYWKYHYRTTESQTQAEQLEKEETPAKNAEMIPRNNIKRTREDILATRLKIQGEIQALEDKYTLESFARNITVDKMGKELKNYADGGSFAQEEGLLLDSVRETPEYQSASEQRYRQARQNPSNLRQGEKKPEPRSMEKRFDYEKWEEQKVEYGIPESTYIAKSVSESMSDFNIVAKRNTERLEELKIRQDKRIARANNEQSN